MSAPGSNDFANAPLIGLSDPSITPTADLTPDGAASPPTEYEGYPDDGSEMTAWWKFTPEVSQHVTMTTAGTHPTGGGVNATMDTVLWVFRSDVENPSVHELVQWWMVDDEGPGYLARINMMQVFAGETYWIRCGMYDAIVGEYVLEVKPSDANLAPAFVPPGLTLTDPVTNPSDPELYLARIITEDYNRVVRGVWVGRRNGDGLTQLARVDYPPLTGSYYAYNLVGSLRWLDDTHFMYVVQVGASDPYTTRIVVGTVAGDVVTFSDQMEYGNYRLSQAPQVEGTTVKFLVQTGYYPTAGVHVLSFDFGAGTVAGLTVTPVTSLGFTQDLGYMDVASSQFAGDNILLQITGRGGYAMLLRPDGTIGPQCPINDLYEDPANPNFITLSIASGFSSWVTSGSSVMGYAYGDHDFWAAATIFHPDGLTSEAAWVHYDLTTGARDVYPMGLTGGSWSNGSAIYTGQSGMIGDSTFLVSFIAPEDDGDAWIQHTSWIVVNAATGTTAALPVTGEEVDFGRMSGIPGGTVEGIAGLVAGSYRGSPTSYIGNAFYPAITAPVDVSVTSVTLEDVRRVFS